MVKEDILNGVLKHSHVCICAYVLRGDAIASSEVLKKGSQLGEFDRSLNILFLLQMVEEKWKLNPTSATYLLNWSISILLSYSLTSSLFFN